MKAAPISKQGSPVSPNVKLVTDWPEPKDEPGCVVIRTVATALNNLDLWVGRGVPGLELTYPRISGSDGAGTVESVGDGVDSNWLGKQVVINAAVIVPESPKPDSRSIPSEIQMIGEHLPGTMAEKFSVPVSNILDIGDCDSSEAAAFALTHLTAWRMMKTRAKLQPGQTVLITGIGGGVALAALIIAMQFGCTTIVTSRHQWKIDKAIELGANYGFVDNGEDWSKEIRKITSRRGVDLCVDSVGKAIHTSCIKSLARGGVFVNCGCTTGPDATTDLARLFWNQLSYLGSSMGDMNEFREIIALFRRGALKPVIDSEYDAAQASEAFARLESGQQFGKVVIRWS